MSEKKIKKPPSQNINSSVLRRIRTLNHRQINGFQNVELNWQTYLIWASAIAAILYSLFKADSKNNYPTGNINEEF